MKEKYVNERQSSIEINKIGKQKDMDYHRGLCNQQKYKEKVNDTFYKRL